LIEKRNESHIAGGEDEEGELTVTDPKLDRRAKRMRLVDYSDGCVE